MVCGKGIVDAHIFEEPADVGIEKSLYFFEVELGVNENRANIGFNYIGEALRAGY